MILYWGPDSLGAQLYLVPRFLPWQHTQHSAKTENKSEIYSLAASIDLFDRLIFAACRLLLLQLGHLKSSVYLKADWYFLFYPLYISGQKTKCKKNLQIIYHEYYHAYIDIYQNIPYLSGLK